MIKMGYIGCFWISVVIIIYILWWLEIVINCKVCIFDKERLLEGIGIMGGDDELEKE